MCLRDLSSGIDVSVPEECSLTKSTPYCGRSRRIASSFFQIYPQQFYSLSLFHGCWWLLWSSRAGGNLLSLSRCIRPDSLSNAGATFSSANSLQIFHLFPQIHCLIHSLFPSAQLKVSWKGRFFWGRLFSFPKDWGTTNENAGVQPLMPLELQDSRRHDSSGITKSELVQLPLIASSSTSQVFRSFSCCSSPRRINRKERYDAG